MRMRGWPYWFWSTGSSFLKIVFMWNHHCYVIITSYYLWNKKPHDRNWMKMEQWHNTAKITMNACLILTIVIKKLIAIILMAHIFVSAFPPKCWTRSMSHRNFRPNYFVRKSRFPENFGEANLSTCMEGYIGNGWMCSIPDSWNDFNSYPQYDRAYQ